MISSHQESFVTPTPNPEIPNAYPTPPPSIHHKERPHMVRWQPTRCTGRPLPYLPHMDNDMNGARKKPRLAPRYSIHSIFSPLEQEVGAGYIVTGYLQHSRQLASEREASGLHFVTSRPTPIYDDTSDEDVLFRPIKRGSP